MLDTVEASENLRSYAIANLSPKPPLGQSMPKAFVSYAPLIRLGTQLISIGAEHQFIEWLVLDEIAAGGN